MNVRQVRILMASCGTMLHEFILFLSTISYVTGFIIPEELPSLLSLLYSNIPPVKKGTDSRFGIGFRLGPHADFQIMMEVGPQSNTAPIGPDSEPPGKRDTLKMQNPQTLVNLINKWKMPHSQHEDSDSTDAQSDLTNAESNIALNHDISDQKEETGCNWLSSWRDAISKNSLFSKIKFKPVAGIDYRMDTVKSKRRTIIQLPEKPSFVDQLSQLYRQPSEYS